MMIAILMVNFVNAQWVKSNNPISGYVTCIVTNNSYIFTGTNSGIYRSSNNGISWDTVNSGLTNKGILSIASNGNMIFAGTSSGVFLSTNNGNNWVTKNTGLTDSIYGITSIALKGDTIFAGTNGKGIYYSSNNGNSWVKLNTGLSGYALHVTSLTLNGNNIFFGTEIDGVFLSTDNGLTWDTVNNGLLNPSITVLTYSGNIIYAGTWGGSSIFRSSDNGSNWTAIGNFTQPYHTTAIAVKGNNIYVGTYNNGIFLSTNNGNSWTAIDTGLSNPNITSIAIKDSNLLAGTQQGGVYLSTNNGSYWTKMNCGLTTSNIYTIAEYGGKIFAGTSEGVFASSDNGNTWIPMNIGLLGHTIKSFVKKSNNFYAASDDGISVFSDSLNCWLMLPNTGISFPSIVALTVKDTNIYAGTVFDGVYLSTNNGNNWIPINSGLPNLPIHGLYVLAANNTNVFVGIWGSGMLTTSNNGSNWTSANLGLQNSEIRSIVISGNNIYTSTTMGLYISSNNGNSWSNIISGSDIFALAVYGNNIFASPTNGQGIIFSSDSGISWNAMDTGFTTNNIISSIAIIGNNIFAGSVDGVVWKRPLSDFNLQYPMPGAAGNITGTNTVCQGQNNVSYTVTPIIYASNYIWTLPNGATGSNNTNSITVNYANNSQSGTISVYGSNPGGNGASSNLSITVNPLPAQTGSINGTTNVTEGQQNVQYSVPVIANATSYSWTLPNGAIGISTTNSISVNFSFTAISGNIIVKGNNTCGNGDSSILYVTVNHFVPNCSAQFDLVADTAILHHYFIVNNTSGIQPIHYNWSWGDGTHDTIAYPTHTYTTAGYYNICLSIIDSVGCTVTYCDSSFLQKSPNAIISLTVIPQGSVWIAKNESSDKIKIYPNPVTDKLIIDLQQLKNLQNTTLSIYDIQGKLILQQLINQLQTELNIRHFAKGVYVVKVNNLKNNMVRKFVKE